MATIEQLPSRARVKFTQLVDAENDAHALMSSPQRRLAELRSVMTNAPHADTAESVDREMRRLEHQFVLYRHRWEACVNLNTQISHWLTTLPSNAVLSDHHEPVIASSDKDAFVATIDHIRSSIDTLKQDIKATKRAPLSPGEKKELMRTYIASLGNTYKPAISFAADQCAVSFRQDQETSQIQNLTTLLAWLDPERLMAKLDVVIDAQPTPKSAMTVAARRQRVSELSDALDEAERKEEALIEKAFDLGHPIERRRDADPAAVLNVKISQPIKSAA